MHIVRVCERLPRLKLISDFAFLSTEKSGKSRIKNRFLDSPKGAQPKKIFLDSTLWIPNTLDSIVSGMPWNS